MKAVLTAVMAAAALHATIWYAAQETTTPPDVRGSIDYVSYSPYVGGHDPKDQRTVSAEQIERDMKVVSEIAGGVRTYSVIDGVDQVPALADKAGLNVMLGAWVGDTPERDQAEMDTVVQLAKQHRNVQIDPRRQRSAVPWRTHGRRADRANPRREAAGPGAGIDR